MIKRNMQYSNKSNIEKDKCLVCSTVEDLEYHRIIPSGPYSNENVVILCKMHHMAVHRKIKEHKRFSDNIDYRDCIDEVAQEYQCGGRYK